MRTQLKALLALTAGILLGGFARPAQAVPIQIHYIDAAGYGFNDPLMGPTRRAAFEITMSAFASMLKGSVPITVDTYFDYNMSASGGYNDGWPNTLVRDFRNRPMRNTYYPASLANQLAKTDLDRSKSDMTIYFNGNMDIAGGKYGEKWYYGFDGNAGNDVDFITEAAHGFLRGIGFYTLLNPATGEFFELTGDQTGYPDILSTKLAFVWDIYKIKLTDLPADLRKWVLHSELALAWIGPSLTQAAGIHVPMHAPATPAGEPESYGVADHFSINFGLYEIMWPWYVAPCHDIAAARYALIDMGWQFH